jgi:Tfp pilus assembly protein PilV
MTRNERGNTLIAVTVALIILAVGLTALAKTQTALLAARNVADNRSVALGVARGYMEELRARDPTTLTNEGPVSLNERGDITPGGPYSGSVEVTQAAPNLLRLRVLVAVPRTTGSLELVSLVYRPSP